MDTIDKPDELLALHGVTQEMFDTLRTWFDVPGQVSLDLHDIDSAVEELGDPQMIAAMAMRKLQGLRLLATPGVRTSTDVVISIVQDLDRALVQAPSMHLRRRAASADWDAALADLTTVEQDAPPTPSPQRSDEDDPDVVRFRTLHRKLHTAVRAVVEASDGAIRYLR